MKIVLEADIEKKVVDWAEARGWEVIKMNIQGNRGYPDRLFISLIGIHVWIELKKRGETPRKLQAYRIRKLQKRAVNAHWCDNVAEAKEILKFYE